MHKILLILLLAINLIVCAQETPKQYMEQIAKADSLYSLQDYKNGAQLYSKAFSMYSSHARWTDRYNAACLWALAGNADSAFYNINAVPPLFERANKEPWAGIDLLTDPDFENLYRDKRWQPLLAKTRQLRYKNIPNLNERLTEELEAIYILDQKYRREIGRREEKYGRKSKEMEILWDTIGMYDSINLLKVKAILDKHGWPAKNVVGEMGVSSTFLVIQHADLPTQEKYLPLMRDAVKKGDAKGHQLALLEDRIAIRNGRRQIYGSQIGINDSTGQYYIAPLDDPDNVDKRREAMGLQPLTLYASGWQIKWDVEQYKKDLPAIEAYEKALNRK